MGVLPGVLHCVSLGSGEVAVRVTQMLVFSVNWPSRKPEPNS